MLQERPAVCFLELITSSSQSKAGRAPTGRSRHQPNQSKVPSQAVVDSSSFHDVFSQRHGRLHLLSDQEPSSLWSQPLNVSVSSLVPFLSSSFLLSFLSHRNHLWITEPFSLHSDSAKCSGLQVLPEYIKEGSGN